MPGLSLVNEVSFITLLVNFQIHLFNICDDASEVRGVVRVEFLGLISAKGQKSFDSIKATVHAKAHPYVKIHRVHGHAHENNSSVFESAPAYT